MGGTLSPTHNLKNHALRPAGKARITLERVSPAGAWMARWKLALALFFFAALAPSQTVGPTTGPAYLVPNGGFVAVGTSSASDLPPAGMSTQGLVITHLLNPEIDFNATGNLTNLKQWQMTVNTDGHFELASSFSEGWQTVQTLLQVNNPANDPNGLGVNTALNFNAASVTARVPANPSLSLYEYDNGPDAKRWIMQSVSSKFWLRAVSDDQSAAKLVS